MVAFHIYLGSAGSVLSGTTSNQLRVKLQEFIIESHVLLFGKNGVIVLQAVLLQESGITIGIRVRQYVINELERYFAYP